MVSAFYSDDPSSNPAEFSIKIVDKNNENKQKQAGFCFLGQAMWVCRWSKTNIAAVQVIQFSLSQSSRKMLLL